MKDRLLGRSQGQGGPLPVGAFRRRSRSTAYPTASLDTSAACAISRATTSGRETWIAWLPGNLDDSGPRWVRHEMPQGPV